ncbi:MAG: ABC transporter ATP-binding protein [Gallionellaceae bacterium]|jgi:ABC-type bacteriocin/lantibiotic exporter with double-glycine peptidase domain
MKHLDYVLNLMRFAFRENPLLYASMFISLLSTFMELIAMSALLPLFTLVSGGTPDPNEIIVKVLALTGVVANANVLLWVFIVLLALRIVTQLIGQSLSMYLGKRMMAQICTRAFKKIITDQPIRDISKNSIGYYTSLAGDESFRASNLLILFTQFVSTAVLSILYFGAIVHYSPTTAMLIAAFMFISLLGFVKVAKLSHRLGGRQTEQSRRTGSVFLDALNNLKTVRAFSAEKYVMEIHRSMMFGYTKILFWLDEIALLTKLVPVLLLLTVFGTWLLLSGKSIESTGLAFVMTMIVYLTRFFPTVGQGVVLLMKVVSDAKSGKDVIAMLNTQPEGNQEGAKRLEKIERIELRDVSFSYDASDRKKILQAVNLKFECGKSYAVMGKSGVGKSTLLDILLKFYLPTSGELHFNDESIADVPVSEVRKKIILVSQEAAIFDDTVTNNIRFGMEATMDEVRYACELSDVGEVIAGMPDGYESRLHYQGKNLSGGQRQRIGIARALLRKPDVLIFDESTSALDKATQERVVANILREYSEKIVIFVTHDPQVMKQVDEVINLEAVNMKAHQ